MKITTRVEKNECNTIGHEISSDDESSGDDSRNIKQLKAQSSQQIISKVKGIIYNLLWNYWSDSEKIGLMATLLDPKLKLMKVWSNETREQAIKKLCTEFNTWQIKVVNDDFLEGIPSSSTLSFMKKVFCHSQRKVNHEIEIDNYLNEMITPTQPEGIDVYQWWNNNRNSFPILSRIARKYLSIPATSVQCECLFSDAGNLVYIVKFGINKKNKIIFLSFNARNILYTERSIHYPVDPSGKPAGHPGEVFLDGSNL
ncbi:6185_t:CDS:2 [Entrophospora sp. SA101]|nr:6185_t:CDS:2 [Entrophospora sp. SA101]